MQQQVKLFDNIEPIEPSNWLTETLRKKRRGIRSTTEKAVSESTISAILTEVQVLNEDKTTLFSGENLNADRASGLNGEVDFIFVEYSFHHIPQLLGIFQKIVNFHN